MTKWAPSLKFIQLHASNKMKQLQQRKQLLDHATEYDVILTTYELAKTPALLYFFQCTRSLPGPGRRALDQEPHDTDFHSDAQDSFRKYTLTDTPPLQNNLVELWSLVNFLYPEIFTISEGKYFR